MSTSSNKDNPEPSKIRFTRNVVIKAVILFIFANLVFAMIYPMPILGRTSAYNLFFPGRQRLPYGDNPQKSFNTSLFNLEAMFASHELSGKSKPSNEFRVLVIGDSATWGFLLEPNQTLTANINAAGAQLPDGRIIRAYNLGYPVMSVTKDLLLLSYAMRYEPDLIVWPLTLESLPYDKQVFPPLLQNNPTPVKALIEKYNLNIQTNTVAWVEPNLLRRTIVGSRRSLADLFRLQLLGMLWSATGIDQDISGSFTPLQSDLQADLSFHDLEPGEDIEKKLAFDVLAAGIRLAGDIPVFFINEPMYISQGENSDVRYNYYYPRWAYDQYRKLMIEQSIQHDWNYLDLWNVIPNSEFTNSAVHLSPRGSILYAQQVLEAIFKIGTKYNG